MRIAPDRPRRTRREGVVPMINVGFLLLVFFLLVAEIAPPDPFAVNPPGVAAPEPLSRGEDILHVAADGRLAHGTARSEAVFAQIAAGEGVLVLRADRSLPAAELAALLGRIAAAGRGEVRLVTVGH